MGGCEECVEVVQGPERRVNVGIVRDVIAEICHWRREDRRQPNRVDAELRQIRQTLRDPSQITNAVAASVLERSRIDLIDDAGLPPRSTLHETYRVRSAMMMGSDAGACIGAVHEYAPLSLPAGRYQCAEADSPARRRGTTDTHRPRSRADACRFCRRGCALPPTD